MLTTEQSHLGDTVVRGHAVRPMRHLLLAVLLFAFGVVTLLLAISGDVEPVRPGRNEAAVVAGVVLCGFAVLLAWVSLRRAIWHGRPVLVLGPLGLFDAREQREPIPWSALQSAVQLTYSGIPNVVLFMNEHPEPIRAALRPRALRAARRSLFANAVTKVESIGLECPQERLVSLLLEHGERHGAPFASGDNEWIDMVEVQEPGAHSGAGETRSDTGAAKL